MLKQAIGMAVVLSAVAVAPALAQAQAPATPTPAAPASPAPSAPADQTPAPGTTKPAAGGQKVGQTGNPDPGVNFINVVENPHVRVLQVTLQPGAVRRPHVHNDVTFHMLVPITGSLELTVEKEPVITTVPGQAYYMVKGQTHTFANKSAAAVQVIELFIKPDPGTTAAPAAGTGTPAPATTPDAPAPATPAPATPAPTTLPAK